MATVEDARKKSRWVVEIRTDAMPLFVDTRGQLVADVFPLVRKDFPHWQAEQGQVLIADRNARPKNQIVLGIRQSLVVVEDAKSLSHFVSLVEQVIRAAYPTMSPGWSQIERVGVRVMEVARSPKATYEALRAHILEKFHKLPLDIPLEHVDSQVLLVHKYGRYSIGPTRVKDEWLGSVFVEPDESVPDIGVAVDIDSFVRDVSTKTADDLISTVNQVVTLTQTVEESLFAAAGIVDG